MPGKADRIIRSGSEAGFMQVVVVIGSPRPCGHIAYAQPTSPVESGRQANSGGSRWVAKICDESTMCISLCAAMMVSDWNLDLQPQDD